MTAADGDSTVILPSAAMNVSVFLIGEREFTVGELEKIKPNGEKQVILPAGSNPKAAIISSNAGVYSDAACGVSFDSFLLQPGCYAVVVSTFEPDYASFQLILHSNHTTPLSISRNR